ncbi:MULTISPECIES: NAD kinase [unclassified Brevibacterium]|uniref:NAD kinase n=1 Tax=unclassified Brevibacterium TaxID=2614124 RepID=UPI001485BB59|nr:NAD kinase [Brevibacterium sp. 2SA]MCM1012747.1 NAD kinase [Brevibacterium sp. XM4083]
MSRYIMVLLHPQREDSAVAAVQVWKALLDAGITPVVLDEEILVIASRSSYPAVHQELLSRCVIINASDLPEWRAKCELVIVLGGDGTILRAAERFHGSGVPLMGINLGHVGFLAESEKEDLDEAVHRAAARDYLVEERLALDVAVWHEGEIIYEAWALNEVTVEKTSKARMIDVVLGVDSRPVSSFGCDGVILATPTGSTAYSFSAGGPIVWPDVEALLLVPISAHALFTEPLVVNPNSRLGVEITPSNPDFAAVLWSDGRRGLELPAGSRVEAKRSESPIKLARLHTGPFTDRLVAKFRLPVSGWRGPIEGG